MISQHVKKLFLAMRFPTSADYHFGPRTIEPGVEEVEIMMRGRGAFEHNGEFVDIHAGSIVWFYPGDIVEAITAKENPYVTIVFRFAVTGSEPAVMRPRFTQWEDLAQCRRFCFDMLKRFHAGFFSDPYHANCLYSRFIWESMDSENRQRQESWSEPLEKAVDFIEQHFAENLDVAAIAKHAGISASHLHLKFREHLNCSPRQLVLRLRLAKAMELLCTTDMQVKEIAGGAGFSDVNNFCKFFKQRTGGSPLEYRAQMNPPIK